MRLVCDKFSVCERSTLTAVEAAPLPTIKACAAKIIPS